MIVPAESSADRAVFLNSDDFGEAVTYLAVGGSPVTIYGLWQETPDQVEFGDAAGDIRRATLTISADDIACPVDGDLVTRQSTGALRKVVPPIDTDGAGMHMLTLAKVS